MPSLSGAADNRPAPPLVQYHQMGDNHGLSDTLGGRPRQSEQIAGSGIALSQEPVYDISYMRNVQPEHRLRSNESMAETNRRHLVIGIGVFAATILTVLGAKWPAITAIAHGA